MSRRPAIQQHSAFKKSKAAVKRTTGVVIPSNPDAKEAVRRGWVRVKRYVGLQKVHVAKRTASHLAVEQAVQSSPDPLLLEPYDWGEAGRPATKALHYVPGVGFVVGQD